jgi:hypothetical protein
MALAWPVVLESQSHLRPGQSRGFQAKPGRNTTRWRVSIKTTEAGLGDSDNVTTVVDDVTELGFRTGTVRVGPDDTAPTPLDTAPLQGWGTHRTRFFKVLMLNRGSI